MEKNIPAAGGGKRAKKGIFDKLLVNLVLIRGRDLQLNMVLICLGGPDQLPAEDHGQQSESPDSDHQGNPAGTAAQRSSGIRPMSRQPGRGLYPGCHGDGLFDGLELLAKNISVGIALVPVFLKACQNHVIQLLRNVGIHFSRRKGPLELMLHGDAQGGVARKGDFSRHHFKQDDAQGINIRPGIGGFPRNLLRRHVFRSSDH